MPKPTYRMYSPSKFRHRPTVLEMDAIELMEKWNLDWQQLEKCFSTAGMEENTVGAMENALCEAQKKKLINRLSKDYGSLESFVNLSEGGDSRDRFKCNFRFYILGLNGSELSMSQPIPNYCFSPDELDTPTPEDESGSLEKLAMSSPEDVTSSEKQVTTLESPTSYLVPDTSVVTKQANSLNLGVAPAPKPVATAPPMTPKLVATAPKQVAIAPLIKVEMATTVGAATTPKPATTVQEKASKVSENSVSIDRVGLLDTLSQVDTVSSMAPTTSPKVIIPRQPIKAAKASKLIAPASLIRIPKDSKVVITSAGVTTSTSVIRSVATPTKPAALPPLIKMPKDSKVIITTIGATKVSPSVFQTIATTPNAVASAPIVRMPKGSSLVRLPLPANQIDLSSKQPVCKPVRMSPALQQTLAASVGSCIIRNSNTDQMMVLTQKQPTGTVKSSAGATAQPSAIEQQKTTLRLTDAEYSDFISTRDQYRLHIQRRAQLLKLGASNPSSIHHRELTLVIQRIQKCNLVVQSITRDGVQHRPHLPNLKLLSIVKNQRAVQRQQQILSEVLRSQRAAIQAAVSKQGVPDSIYQHVLPSTGRKHSTGTKQCNRDSILVQSNRRIANSHYQLVVNGPPIQKSQNIRTGATAARAAGQKGAKRRKTDKAAIARYDQKLQRVEPKKETPPTPLVDYNPGTHIGISKLFQDALAASAEPKVTKPSTFSVVPKKSSQNKSAKKNSQDKSVKKSSQDKSVKTNPQNKSIVASPQDKSVNTSPQDKSANYRKKQGNEEHVDMIRVAENKTGAKKRHSSEQNKTRVKMIRVSEAKDGEKLRTIENLDMSKNPKVEISTPTSPSKNSTSPSNHIRMTSSTDSSPSSSPPRDRSRHNTVERERREEEKAQLHILRDILPGLENQTRTSKQEICDTATRHIKALEHTQKTYHEEKEKASEKNRCLLRKLRLLQR